MSSGPPPAPVFVVALAVLIGGIVAVAVHDDGPRTTTAPVSSSAEPSTSTTSSTTRTTVASSRTTTTGVVTSTARPAVPSPEAAANGLWAAYTASNRTAAERFATEDVIRVLFEVPFNGEQGTFRSCKPQDDGFDCAYTQPSAHYSMIVMADSTGSFKVVELTVSSST